MQRIIIAGALPPSKLLYFCPSFFSIYFHLLAVILGLLTNLTRDRTSTHPNITKNAHVNSDLWQKGAIAGLSMQRRILNHHTDKTHPTAHDINEEKNHHYDSQIQSNTMAPTRRSTRAVATQKPA